ncbi:MAG: DUF1080 domain-containing protein [Bryobacteraceae bacterium]
MRLGVAGAVLLAMGFAAAQDQPWRPLFDGTTSKGWEEAAGKPFPTNSWVIEDSCLKALARTDGFESIRTVETFKSFELQFEWKLAKLGRSGVKYLRGLEYPLVDIYSLDAVADPTRITGALFSILAPSGANWKLGVFNESRLIVHGDHVEHWLNGVQVLSFETTNPAVQAALRGMLPKGAETPIVTESPIGLESHGSETWFRNIKIRVLP